MDGTDTHLRHLVVVLLILCKNIETNQFCESYAQNYNNIDYGLRQIKDNHSVSNSYLFIDNHYWDLDFNDNIDDHKKTVKLWRTESRRSLHWFGGHYSMAIGLWRPGNQIETCIFGLINANKTIIDFRVRVGHSGREHKIKEYQKVIETNIEFSDFDPTIAYVPNREQYSGKYVVFVEQKQSDTQTYHLISKVFEFDDNYIGAEVLNTSLRQELDPTALRYLDNKLDVMSITAQEDETGQYGLIVLFRFDNVIKYCWTQDRQLSDNCEEENLKVLIDCSDSEPNVNNGTENIATHNINVNNITENVSKQLVDRQEMRSDDGKKDFPVFLYVLLPILVSILIVGSIYLGIKYKKSKSDSDIDLQVLEEVVDEEDVPQQQQQQQQTNATNNKQKY